MIRSKPYTTTNLFSPQARDLRAICAAVFWETCDHAYNTEYKMAEMKI